MKILCKWIYIPVVIVFLLCGYEKSIDNKTGESDNEMQDIVFAVQNGCSDFLRIAADEFMSENTHVNTRIMELPGERSEVYQVLSSALAGEDVSLDVFVTEDVWLSEFVARGYVHNINNLVNFDKNAYPPQLSETLYYNDKLYAVPIELD